MDKDAFEVSSPKALPKRVRAPNFTSEETIHLCDLVEKYKAVIENRQTDGATLRQKQAAWQTLAAEYNSTTKSYARTAENLKACYQNQKSKVKKQYSHAKMIIPVVPVNQEQLVSALQMHGTENWSEVARNVGATENACKFSFKDLVSEAKKEDANFKKAIKCTGGGPPPTPPNSEVLEKVKSLIGPALDGLYTIYDGDSSFMKEQQELLLPLDRAVPIDGQGNVEALEVGAGCSYEQPQQIQTEFNRSDLKRKRDPLLIVTNENIPAPEGNHSPDMASTPMKSSRRRPNKKMSVTENFASLADNKNQLVTLQRKISAVQLEHEITINNATQKFEHERKMWLKEEELINLKIELCKKQLKDQ